MGNWFEKISLVGKTVKLIPLVDSHKDGLLKAASDGELWKLWFTSVPSLENIDNYIQHAISDTNKGIAHPFVVVDLKNQ